MSDDPLNNLLAGFQFTDELVFASLGLYAEVLTELASDLGRGDLLDRVSDHLSMQAEAIRNHASELAGE